MKKSMLFLMLWLYPLAALAAPPDPWTACSQGQLAVVKKAVEKDPKLARAHQKESGLTLLQVAADQGQLELVRYLLDHGAGVNERDAGGSSALHSACHPRGLQCARLLLQRGADINARDQRGRTPLFGALGYPQVAQEFLDKGARVEIVDKEGMTPLLEAAHWGQLGSLKLILDRKGDVRARSKEGGTALHWALAGAGWNDEVDLATQEAIVSLLLARGLKANVTDKAGGTPLHWFAARLGRLRAAEILLSKGASIQAKDQRGRTPLYLAINGDLPIGAIPTRLWRPRCPTRGDASRRGMS